MNKKQIIEEIERLIDYYTPYRPLTDRKEMQEVRKVLWELLDFIKDVKSGETEE